MTFLDVLKQDARWILDQGPAVSNEFEFTCSQAIYDLFTFEIEQRAIRKDSAPVSVIFYEGLGFINIIIKERTGYDLSLKLPNL
jgi:hypothetical protein